MIHPSSTPISTPPPPVLKVALWSLRKRMETSSTETLGLLKSLGVTEVEITGFYKYRPRDFKDDLKAHNLTVCSIHGPTITSDRPIAEYLTWANDKLALFETKTLCLETTPRAFMGVSEANASTIYDKLVRVIFEIAASLATKGIRLSYHCYDHDFRIVRGERLISRLFHQSGLSNLGLQLDTYWYTHSAVSPEEIAKWPLKIHSIHLNNRDDTDVCRALDGKPDGICGPYMKALMPHGSAIDWILENDPVQDAGAMKRTSTWDVLEKCVRDWPETWRTLCRAH